MAKAYTMEWMRHLADPADTPARHEAPSPTQRDGHGGLHRRTAVFGQGLSLRLVGHTCAVTWGVILGLIGAATGVLSFAFTVYAWRTERGERRAADGAEREARLAEVAIERERLDTEQRERERQHHADITTIQLPHERTRDGERIYRFKLRNMGPGYSKHVRASLQMKEGRPLGGLPFAIALERGEEHPFDVPVPRELWEGAQPPLEVVVEWRNDRGRREVETSNLEFDYDI